MKKIFLAVVMLLSFIFVGQVQAATTPEWIKNLPAAKNAKQILVVAQLGEKTTAWISMHEKNSAGEWTQIITTPGFIGKNGLGKTKEGDSMTPVGVFHFNKAFGIKSNPGCAISYTQVDENIYWSGDAKYKYNQLVDIRKYAKLNKEDSEHLIDYNPNYNYCLNISYNEKGTAGKGSAIFLHCFGDVKTWTAGGVAIPEAQMLKVMQNVKADCVVVIDTLENLNGKI